MYFNKCRTLDELKREYHKLAMRWHPDRKGGDLETMKQINAEYDRVFEILKREHNRTADAYHQTTETPDKFRDVIEALIHLAGLKIELCGSWLWISGDTKRNREALKHAGCRWSNNKQMWYWRHAEDAHHWHRGQKHKTIEEIRSKYGSQTIKEETA